MAELSLEMQKIGSSMYGGQGDQTQPGQEGSSGSQDGSSGPSGGETPGGSDTGSTEGPTVEGEVEE